MTSTIGNKRPVSELSEDIREAPALSSEATSTKATSESATNNEIYECIPVHGQHNKAVSCVSFAPSIRNISTSHDNVVCASASADGTVRIWDITNHIHEPRSSTQKSEAILPAGVVSGHSKGINDIAWSPRTPGLMATASDDKTLRIWDVTRSSDANSPFANSILGSPSSGAGAELQNHYHDAISDALVEFKGHSNFCFSVKFSPQGNLIASGSFDETVKVWDVRTGECVSTLPAHSDPVTGVDFNRDGTCIVSSSHDGLMRIWDVATGECLKTIYAEGNPPVTFVKYSPNGKFVLSGMLDGKLRLWNVTGNDSKNPTNILPLTHSSKDYLSIGLSSSQGRGGQCTKTYGGHVNSKYCIFSAFSVANPKRQSIVTGSEDGNVHIYDLQTRNTVQVLKAHDDACLAVATHDKKEILASGGMTKDRTVKFWVPKSL